MDYVIKHHGVKGQRWGIRRFQNEDGSLTEAGKERYYNTDGSLTKEGAKSIQKSVKIMTNRNSSRERYSEAFKYINENVEKDIKSMENVKVAHEEVSNTEFAKAVKDYNKLTYETYKPYLDKQLARNYDQLPDNEKKQISKEQYIKDREGSLDSGEDYYAKQVWFEERLGGKNGLNKARTEYDAAYKKYRNEINKISQTSKLLKDLDKTSNKKTKEFIEKRLKFTAEYGVFYLPYESIASMLDEYEFD